MKEVMIAFAILFSGLFTLVAHDAGVTCTPPGYIQILEGGGEEQAFSEGCTGVPQNKPFTIQGYNFDVEPFLIWYPVGAEPVTCVYPGRWLLSGLYGRNALCRVPQDATSKYAVQLSKV